MDALRGVGLWSSALEFVAPSEARDRIAEVEAQGWSAFWFGESYGREAFSQAQLLLGATSTLTVATGIANIYGRDALAANAASRLLTSLSGDRFILGLGVSHQPLVERLRGHDYGRPVAAMRDYLAAMDGAVDVAPEGRQPRTTRVVAALGPAMLALAAERADGSHPYLVTPEHTAVARAALGPGKLLAVEQGAVLTTDRDTFTRRAHSHLEIYTGLPNYRNNWKRLGFTDDDLPRGGSDRLKDALVVWGDAETIARRVQAHVDAGADHVCVQLLGDSPFEVPAREWRELAPALTGLGR